MLPPKLVTFDVSGTLLLFRTPIAEKYFHTALKFGVKTDIKVLGKNFKEAWAVLTSEHPNFGKTTGLSWQNWWTRFVEKTLKDFVKPEEKTKISKIAKDLIDFYKTEDAFTVRPGTKILLEYLKSKNVKTGVISNNDPRIHEVLELMNLKQYFDFVIISYDFICSKPDKRIFEYALSLGGCVPANEAVHVGNELQNDYYGAKRCGMNAILISSHPEELKQVDECEAFEDFFALINYFKQLYQCSEI